MWLNLFGWVNIASIADGGDVMKRRAIKNLGRGWQWKKKDREPVSIFQQLSATFVKPGFWMSNCQNFNLLDSTILTKIFCVCVFFFYTCTSCDLNSTNLKKFVFQFLYLLLFHQAPDVFVLVFTISANKPYCC